MMSSYKFRRQIKIDCILVIASVLVWGSLNSNAIAEPTVYPTGTTIYNKKLAYHCDYLFGTSGSGIEDTYLISMDGQVLHKWSYQGFPAKFIDPDLVGGMKGVLGVQTKLMNGVERRAQTDIVPGSPSTFYDKSFGYVDWNGKILWQWGAQAPGGSALQHHDFERLANGNTLILSSYLHKVKFFGDRDVLDDMIYEVSKDGKIIWSWSALGHIDQFGFTLKQLEIIKNSQDPDVLHINDMRPLGPNKWEEQGDKRFAADNILISSRNANFTAIINRHTGDIVWEIGPNYSPREDEGLGPDKLPRPIDQISGQHGGYMIPEGLPGAGDILMLDNQGEGGYPPAPLSPLAGSRVLEINPVTKQIVWEYNARDSGENALAFYTPFIGNVQRLPNGNTLIDEGIYGRLFQVTPDGQIVWEYVSPFRGDAPGAPIAGRPKAMSNWIYRVQAVPFTWLPDGR